ncbi:hypothetical protein AGOR_G00220430 [Albula goreensis]|uniref:Uncharacterized protein n=1 Tax=Albula goreensis TaxID=1534307 RepID=A0A8T3CNR6_9TELE|nr:hypothetical protein AGOR_G00220430 [Albula goreensis]
MTLKYTISLWFLLQGIPRAAAVMPLSALGNVTVESKNLQSELRWTPVTGRESVEYKVQFEASSLNSDEWMDILGCSPTNKTHCNLTAGNIETMNVTLRVLVLDGNQTILWGKSHPFHAITQSLLGPPTVTLHPNPENGQLSVHIQDPFPWTLFSKDLQHRLSYRKDNGDWMVYGNVLTQGRINSSLQVGSNYCVQVSYAYRNQPRGNSIASTPNCIVIRESEAQRSVRVMWMTILGLVLLLVVLLLFYTGSRHYSKIKLALQPPLKLPLHLEQFLSGEERIPQFPGIISDPEEKCLEISVVIMEEEEGGSYCRGAGEVTALPCAPKTRSPQQGGACPELLHGRPQGLGRREAAFLGWGLGLQG